MGQADPSCPVCTATDWRAQLYGVADYITRETFDIVRCASCGTGRTVTNAADLSRYYPPRYRGERQKLTLNWRTSQRARAVERILGPANGRRLLDWGCGSGAFAIEMQRRGWNVCVTEIDQSTLAQLREHGIEGKLPDVALREGFSEKRFDAITAWHVLEHVHDPTELARWVQANLAPDGIFHATVPNASSFQAKTFGRHWMHWDVPRHLWHFNPTTLARLLERTAMQVVASSNVAIEYDLFGVMQSALNVMCIDPSVLFESLTGKPDTRGRPFHVADVLISYLAAAPLGAIAVPWCLTEWITRHGATLTVTARHATAS